ncbi:sulfurtransferase [Streptomyces roseolilacinus]|uniref:sulfurtransferase n=1 Tax=Streptomyces roseolilacinus TaxID=66904 RepID=UPI003823FF22
MTIPKQEAGRNPRPTEATAVAGGAGAAGARHVAVARDAPVAVPGPLVTPRWLGERLGAAGLVVLDASVGAHRDVGRRVPGARRFDIDGALSDHDAPLPHTAPDAARFTEAVRDLGVDDTSTVVVYDAAGLHSAARAWWMLRASGFDRVAVLDGGLPGWAAAGLPVEDGHPAAAAPVRGGFTARPREGWFVGSATVAAALADPDAVVLDARTRGRFAGTEPEPRAGLRGGHMPGAVNLPFGDLLDGAGRMRPPAELRELFAPLVGEGSKRLLFSCGSGVTACVLALGAELSGYGDLAVYDGSWSDWGRPSDLPVVTGGAAPRP